MRTPIKARPAESEKSPKPSASPPNVRRSVAELEAAGPSNANPTPSPPLVTKTAQAGPAKLTQKSLSELVQVHSPPKPRYADRSAEARACLTRAKVLLKTSRNTKTEIKNGVFEALDRLFELVKEADKLIKTKGVGTDTTRSEGAADLTFTSLADPSKNQGKLEAQIESHSLLLENHSKEMEELKAAIEQHKRVIENGAAMTHASVTATHSGKANPSRSTLYSLVVTSKDESETGDEVLDKVRKAADAKEGWVKVERVRKAKDRKIIMGFQTTEERDKLKGKLARESQDLHVEEVKNKDPLLILRSVLSANSDEDILRAMRNQNRNVFHNLDKEEDRVVVKFRRKTRNPHTCHVVVGVSPTIWRRATELGCLHVDLQRVRVEDQTPLVQCTRCLGYGHGRRYCKEPADLCSHCGGLHLRSECADFLTGVPPKCQNCTRAKLGDVGHNAFSFECPTRRKWDEIARSTVAYC